MVVFKDGRLNGKDLISGYMHNESIYIQDVIAKPNLKHQFKLVYEKKS